MKKTQKFLLVILLTVILAITLQVRSFATEDKNIEIICTEATDYIFYLKDLTKGEFKYAISEDKDATEMQLNYINSVQDDENNNVAIITNEKYEQIKLNDQYLFVKAEREGTETLVINGEKIDFESAFNKATMESVETTTKRIATKELTNIVEQEEEVDGVKVTVRIGGLEITQDNNATYYSSMTKLPASQYTELMELAEKINTEYEQMDMFNRIQLAKEFDDLYKKLANEQNWVEVEDMKIMQPNDAQQGEQYIVYIRMVDDSGNETIDVKFMTSQREERQEEISNIEERAVQETAKLPITGDSIILFVILAVILIVAIILFVRMKSIQNKKVEK